jgi:TetR/AcrR family transcriptional regulator, transcriptional repressor for nem operon
VNSPTSASGPSDKRSLIVEAAAKLVYTQGFSRTTLAEIAQECGVSLGNMYYYFKTKEAIGEALIDKLSAEQAAVRKAWEAKPDSRDRVASFIQVTLDQKDLIAQNGCPVGTLCSELNKDGGPLALCSARLLDDIIGWLEAQFRLLGRGAAARDSAIHVVSTLQGASLLTHSLHDARYLAGEAKRLKAWLRAL